MNELDIYNCNSPVVCLIPEIDSIYSTPKDLKKYIIQSFSVPYKSNMIRKKNPFFFCLFGALIRRVLPRVDSIYIFVE